MKNELSQVEKSPFGSVESFESAQRMASALSKSTLVPKAYQDNVPNTLIAMEMAHRVGISPFMVMQNLDIIHGKPSWRSTAIISVINTSGRFKPLRFKFEGEKGKPEYGCRAWTTDNDGEIVEGPLVNWKMVKAEGWLDKSGSKWKTMPELMFQYRAASFFGRLYCPDLLIGMHSADELNDSEQEISPVHHQAITGLLRTANLSPDQKDEYYEELDHMNAERAREVISFLKENQIDIIAAGENFNQGDIQEKLNLGS